VRDGEEVKFARDPADTEEILNILALYRREDDV
jgi:hypothetical protein